MPALFKRTATCDTRHEGGLTIIWTGIVERSHWVICWLASAYLSPSIKDSVLERLDLCRDADVRRDGDDIIVARDSFDFSRK